MSDLIEYLNKFGLATRNYSNVRILVVAQNANQERILHFSTSPGIEIQSLGERAILRIKKSFFEFKFSDLWLLGSQEVTKSVGTMHNPRCFGKCLKSLGGKIRFFLIFQPRFSTHFAQDTLRYLYFIRTHSAISWEFRSQKSKNLIKWFMNFTMHLFDGKYEF